MTERAPSRTQVRQVRCPACGAEPGRPCRGARGRPRQANHAERVEHAEVMGVLVFFADFSADDAARPREGDAWAEHQHCGGTVVVEAVMLGEVALLCDGCGCRFAARRPRRQA